MRMRVAFSNEIATPPEASLPLFRSADNVIS
jgi:hypothetical protein